MGIFVLGILVGWLAEWLFFTFWIKSNLKSSSSDCSELSALLKAKNKEIDTLKSSLSKEKDSKTENKAESIVSSASTAVPESSLVNTVVKKETSQKTVAKKAVATKTETTTKKPVAKKTVAKKSPAKKASTSKKTTAKKPAGDDLTKLSGIGPSMAATMAELGITSYKKLAGMDDDILRDMLEASGVRLNSNKEAMDSWNEQATLADKGDFEGLKKLQEELKK